MVSISVTEMCDLRVTESTTGVIYFEIKNKMFNCEKYL
jgi:hypothetical protein